MDDNTGSSGLEELGRWERLRAPLAMVAAALPGPLFAYLAVTGGSADEAANAIAAAALWVTFVGLVGATVQIGLQQAEVRLQRIDLLENRREMALQTGELREQNRIAEAQVRASEALADATRTEALVLVAQMKAQAAIAARDLEFRAATSPNGSVMLRVGERLPDSGMSDRSISQAILEATAAVRSCDAAIEQDE